MTDLDQLLRDTLHGRAATVTDVPEVRGAVERTRRRSRWLLVAASVATALIAGGGVTVWGLVRGDVQQPAGGGYARTCETTLPAAWKAAFTATPLSVEGKPTTVRELTQYGDLLTWLDADGTQHLGVRTVSGHLRSLDAVLRGRVLSGTSVDDHTLVLSIAPRATTQVPDALVNDIVAVDLRTFAVRDVLRESAQPTGDVVADKAAIILDGTVYWVAVRGAEGPASASAQGTVLAFSLSTGRTRTVGHAPALLTYDDPRGVFWAGGGVRRPHVPPSVPPVEDAHSARISTVSDGRNYAWSRPTRPDLIGWTDAAGDQHLWLVAQLDDGIGPIAVSGPFVFLALSSVRPDVFVLDTRSGAIADSGLQWLGGAEATGNRIVLAGRTDNHSPLISAALDTEYLPELHC